MHNLTRSAAGMAILCAFGLSVTFANAQTDAAAPNPTKDLELIRAKAASDQSLAEMLEQLESMRSSAEPTNRFIRQMLREASEDGDTLTKPFPYVVATQARSAQNRAQYIAQVLQADLNNDGEVAKAELKATLPFSRNSEAAMAFFSSDVDENEIVSAQEIRMAAEAAAGSRDSGRGNRGRIFELFDFDADGTLSPEELDRGIAAFGS